MNKFRTHNCSELSEKEINKNISLSGWIHRKRDHGNLLFIDLRDNYGVTQCVIDGTHKLFKEFGKINNTLLFKLFVLGDFSLVTLSKFVLDTKSSVFALIKSALAPAKEDSDCAKSVKVISPF